MLRLGFNVSIFAEVAFLNLFDDFGLIWTPPFFFTAVSLPYVPCCS